MPTLIPPCADVSSTLANVIPTLFNHVPTSPRRRANVIPTPIPPCADVVPTLDQRYANPYPTMCRRRGLLRCAIIANMMLGPTAFLPAGQRWPDSDEMTLSQHRANVPPTYDQRHVNPYPTICRHRDKRNANPFSTMCRRLPDVGPT